MVDIRATTRTENAMGPDSITSSKDMKKEYNPMKIGDS
jgi:hypothetical protein